MLGNMDTYNSNNAQQPASIIISIQFSKYKIKIKTLVIIFNSGLVVAAVVWCPAGGVEVAATAAPQHSGYNNIINNDNSSPQPAAGLDQPQQRARSKNVLFDNLESTSVTNGW